MDGSVTTAIQTRNGSDVTELRDVAVDHNAAGTIYFAHSHGIRVTRDNGVSWQEIGGTLHRKFVEGNATLSGVTMPLLRTHPDYRAAHQEMLAQLIALVRQGQDAGELNPDLPAELAVRPFISVMRDSEYEQLLRSGAIAPEVLVTALATQLLNSLRKP